MLVVETVVRIRREHASGKAIKAIARDLRLSRKVVRKAIRSPEAAFNYQLTVQPLPRIGPYQERLDALLEENAARVRRDRLRMTRKIGRASCRERVCQYLLISVVAVSLKKNTNRYSYVLYST